MGKTNILGGKGGAAAAGRELFVQASDLYIHNA